MNKPGTRLEESVRLLRGLAGVFEAIEGQQVRLAGPRRHEVSGAVPVRLHDVMRALRLEVETFLG